MPSTTWRQGHELLAHLIFIQEGLQALLKGWKGAGGVGLGIDLCILVLGPALPEAQAGICAAYVACDDCVRLRAKGSFAGQCRRRCILSLVM